MVVTRAKISWGPNKNIINAVTVNKILGYPSTKKAMKTPFAPIRQRTERKTSINLPPIRPSRGPIGRIDLIIP